MPIEAALQEIQRGAVEILPEEDLRARLRAGRSLRVKAGLIPPHRICISATPWC